MHKRVFYKNKVYKNIRLQRPKRTFSTFTFGSFLINNQEQRSTDRLRFAVSRVFVNKLEVCSH